MESLGVWFLGVIALAMVVQAGFMIALALGGLRLARRIEDLQNRLDRELKPALDHLSRLARNAAEVSDLATLQARRIDFFLADTLDKLEDVTSTVRNLVVRPLGPLGDIAAVLKGIKRGVDVYRKLGGHESRGRTAPRRSWAEDDEHLFI